MAPYIFPRVQSEMILECRIAKKKKKNTDCGQTNKKPNIYFQKKYTGRLYTYALVKKDDGFKKLNKYLM